MKSLLICLPTYNEVQNIDFALNSIRNWRLKYPNRKISVINIDDSSPDGTAKKARKIAQTWGDEFFQIVNPGKNGLGPAYLTAFTWGLDNGFELFLEFDADGSHHIEQADQMLDNSESCDLVIGTRWMNGGSIINWPAYRRLISRFGTWYAAKMLELQYRDLTSGFRMLSARLVKDLVDHPVATKGYGFQIESVLRCQNLNLSIREVPITFTERSAGNSKMSTKIALEAFWQVTRQGVRHRLPFGD